MTFHNSMPVASIQILKGVPICGRSVKSRFPFAKMDVGDSFFTTSKSVSGSSSQYGKKNGMKFTTRGYTQDGITGLMCWRIN